MDYERNEDTLRKDANLEGAPIFRPKYHCSVCCNPVDKSFAGPNATCYSCGQKPEFLDGISHVEAGAIYYPKGDWGELNGTVIQELIKFSREIWDAKDLEHTDKMVEILALTFQKYPDFKSFDKLMIPPSSSSGPNHMIPKAERISDRFDIPFYNSIEEIESTGEMKNKSSASARMSSAEDNYRCNIDVNNERILILDDMVTSGSTATGIATALHDKGAAEVGVASITRTVDAWALKNRDLVREKR